MSEMYVHHNHKRMRCGYTTGSCAAAAAKAAAMAFLSHNMVTKVRITIPKGQQILFDVEDLQISDDKVSCAVRKDGGDDIDATHGALIYAEVSPMGESITIDGGKGVGRVTKKGLNQPVGNAAINSVPREMIFREVKSVCDEYGYKKGLHVTISVPEGEELAAKTFNPRLGILGGISIIGTSGIVEPMSQQALVETIKAEMAMRLANGSRYILAVPGNYGEDFSKEIIDISTEEMIKCSNFVGETIDAAVELGAEGLLFIANIGKFIKVAGGIMNTHSRNADARLEILAANASLAGAERETVVNVLNTVMTEDALDILKESGHLEKTMELVCEKVDFYLRNRAANMPIGAIIFSSNHGLLGKTKDVDRLLHNLEAQLCKSG